MTSEVGISPQERLAELRAIADVEPYAAALAAWSWIDELKKRAGRDRGAAERELGALFRSGEAPTELVGPTEGVLITTTTTPLLDPVVRIITNLWMPWQGKHFDADDETGSNRMTSSSSLPAKLLWPSYSMKKAAEGTLAFDFKTYEDAGLHDPDRRVLVIDYSKVDGNPRLIIRRIRDELVQLVPGAYLGKILFQLPGLPELPGVPSLHRVAKIRDMSSDRHAMIGYFALRAAV
jgi:hypothetical protein